MSVSPEQIAHDLAIVYVTNRHAIDVSGSFYVNSTEGLGGAIDSISGGGDVETTTLPDIDRHKTVTVPDGKKRFGLFQPTKEVETSEFVIDDTLRAMISDYRAAHARLLELLAKE